MESFLREKSWSVKLVQGYLAKDRVRATQCETCQATCNLLVRNLGNPNLALFGCSLSKCQHRLIRFDFSEYTQ